MPPTDGFGTVCASLLAIDAALWIGCALAAVMPTAILTSLVQRIEGRTEPWFVPGLFIGVFTLMVLAARPWTMR